MGAHIVGAFEGMDEIGAPSGTSLLKNVWKSCRTSGSAFSLIVSPAEVCLIKITSRPLSGSAGSCEMISRVIK